MTSWLWPAAALAAVAIAAWAYGAREERVAGRVGPATLRAFVVFLVLAGLALPALRGGIPAAPSGVPLLDVSRSMALPVRGVDGAGELRLDAARAALDRYDPDRVILFGETVRRVPIDSVAGLRADHDRSRLAPAIEAAHLEGADSVWVVTDGQLADRDEALGLAADLGLGLREVRIGSPVPRVGLAAFTLPERARAGDTLRATVELEAGGDTAGLPDSVAIEIRSDGTAVAAVRIPRPAPGRTGRAEVSFVPAAPAEEAVWHRYEAVLVEPSDPLGASDRLASWVELSESTGGAVFVSTEPDWEARFLVPSLGRLVLGGSRGFLRLDEGRYLEMDARPRVVDGDVVRRALRGSRVLVVQADPGDVPEWLGAAWRTHPRTLVFVEGAGLLPASGLRTSGPLPGEWYPGGPVPPSPAAALLDGSDLQSVPPAREVWALDAPGRWTVLAARRDRRGEPRPLLVAGRRGERRWAVATTSEWWRWALREGAPRRMYDGAFSGLVGWLVEDATPRLAGLADRPASGERLRWRVRPGARDLEITVADSAGQIVWSESLAEPAGSVMGPALPPGRYEVSLAAMGPDGEFRATRPVEVAPDPREFLPGTSGPPAFVAGVPGPPSSRAARSPRPVWPFALAITLLCAEWVWRHRIGLR